MRNEHSGLEVRIAALERQNRRLRRLGTVALGAVIALTTMAALDDAPAPRVAELRATRFVLTDDNDAERGALEIVDGTTPRLVLRNPQGDARLLAAVDPMTAFLILKDENGKNRVGLAVDAYPHLMMHDEDQTPRLHASVGAKGAVNLLFGDGRGQPLGLGIDADGKIWRRPEIDQEMAARAGTPECTAGAPKDRSSFGNRRARSEEIAGR